MAVIAIGLAMTTSSCQPTQEHPLSMQIVENPAAAGSRLPRLAELPGKGIVMSWVEASTEGHILRFAIHQDDQWIRQGEVARGSNWFINWADFPSVVAIDQSYWLAHWLVKHPGGGTYDYDIATSFSKDAGLTWSMPQSPHRDEIATEHGFVSIFPVGEDAGMIWLDGRKSIPPNSQSTLEEASGNYQLRYTRLHRDGSMGAEQVIDHNTCTCCGTTVATTTAGPVAAWRSRTDEEIRDNYVAQLRNGQWAIPEPLGAEGWEINGCPVNGPMLAAHGMDVAAAWFTAEGDRPRVRAGFSRDGGQHFDQRIEVDEVDPFGRVGIAWIDDRTAVVSWMTAQDALTKKTHLALRTISIDGSTGPAQHLIAVSGGRDTGIPQLVADETGLLLAWTGTTPKHGIHTAWVPSDALAH